MGRGVITLLRRAGLGNVVGAWPSGKAAVFGIAIPRFESWRPSHISLYKRVFLLCVAIS